MDTVDKYEKKKRDEIMLAQAMNNATAILIASNPKLEGDWGEQYKAIVLNLYNYSQLAKDYVEQSRRD